jgi:hypothetical protein
MSTITTSIELDADLLKKLPSPDLAQLAIASVKIVAERLTAHEKWFHAKELLGILVQLQQRASPGYDATIQELLPPTQQHPPSSHWQDLHAAARSTT